MFFKSWNFLFFGVPRMNEPHIPQFMGLKWEQIRCQFIFHHVCVQKKGANIYIFAWNRLENMPFIIHFSCLFSLLRNLFFSFFFCHRLFVRAIVFTGYAICGLLKLSAVIIVRIYFVEHFVINNYLNSDWIKSADGHENIYPKELLRSNCSTPRILLGIKIVPWNW